MVRRLVLIVLLAAGLVDAAPLFDDDAVIDITLRGPIGALFEDAADRTERPFTLTMNGTGYAADVRLRGNSRLRVCRFYPLRLNLDPDEYAATSFAGQDKLKLVTHCRNYGQGEQDLLEEYTAYRIFNVISDISYRTRLLRINYVDTDGKLDAGATNRYGFVIEPDWHLADRIGASLGTLKGVPKKRFDREHAALVFVFQYLIGNTDWGFVRAYYDDYCCHNGDLFDREGQVFFVPYDFDVSGIVNARYAFPDPELRIDKVTRRLYRGLCLEREVLKAALDHINTRRDAIIAAVEQTPGLTARNRNTALKYVGKYFKLAEDEDKLLRTFEKRCI